jgi:hypothetical protein
MSTPQKKLQSATAKRVASYRQRKRDAGLVPKTIWVPDTRDPKFIEEYRRQAKAIAASSSRDAKEADALMEALYAELDLGPIPEYRLPGEK